MSATTIAGATALVTGASRGFGREIATSLVAAGAQVVGVARDSGQLSQLREELGGSFTGVTADAAAPETAGQLIDAYRPAILVLNAGAEPLLRPLPQLTPATALGSAAVAAYAARAGLAVDDYLRAAGPALTTGQVGAAVTRLVTGAPGDDKDAYLLTAAGLAPAP